MESGRYWPNRVAEICQAMDESTDVDGRGCFSTIGVPDLGFGFVSAWPRPR